MSYVIDRKKTTERKLQIDAINALREKGVVQIRNLFKQNVINDINEKWKVYFRYPSISGSVGYSQTSHKKLVHCALLMGKPILTIALNNQITKIIEGFMRSKCTLAEANALFDKASSYEYFGLHSDFAEGWKKSKNMKNPLSKEALKKPIGVGVILYLHDTDHGCFKYSIYSQKILSPHGQKLTNYPEKYKKQILGNVKKFKGLEGDIILFDDRGFHGPDQPSKVDRKTIIFDYYRDKTFGSLIVEPHKIKINDLSGLSARQLRILGINAKNIVENEDYVFTRFKKNLFFPLVSWLIQNSYQIQHIKNLVKNNLFK